MSFLNTTASLVNTTPLPSTVTRSAALAVLHNHELFLRCDPHFVKYTVLHDTSKPAPPLESYNLPAHIKPIGEPAVKLYEVLDHLPNPVWDSNVVSKDEMVDCEDGMWVRLRSPMGIVMESGWKVEGEEGKEGDEGLRMVEEVQIKCSRLLIGIVKGQVEANWKTIHEKLAKAMQEPAGDKPADS